MSFWFHLTEPRRLSKSVSFPEKTLPTGSLQILLEDRCSKAWQSFHFPKYEEILFSCRSSYRFLSTPVLSRTSWCHGICIPVTLRLLAMSKLAQGISAGTDILCGEDTWAAATASSWLWPRRKNYWVMINAFELFSWPVILSLCLILTPCGQGGHTSRYCISYFKAALPHALVTTIKQTNK